MLTQELLKSILHYDPDTGVFTWSTSRPRCVIGGVAGSLDAYGYLVTKVHGNTYKNHRMAWLWVHGELPSEIDHINRNKTDNRIDNLREATHAQNSRNVSVPKTNTSGYLGVHAIRGKWKAQIGINKKKHHLGYFTTPELAHEAYKEASDRLFGEFSRFNSLVVVQAAEDSPLLPPAYSLEP